MSDVELDKNEMITTEALSPRSLTHLLFKYVQLSFRSHLMGELCVWQFCDVKNSLLWRMTPSVDKHKAHHLNFK
jgi:hypothetical protein